MSVCIGAYVLARTGLLAGKTATTHHAAYVDFARKFPDIHVKRGVRYVDDGNLASAGGLACGIDLALHVVERYHGEEVARQTAYELEYQGQGWLKPDSNTAYLKVQTSTNDHPLCPVCSMDIDPAIAPSVYQGHRPTTSVRRTTSRNSTRLRRSLLRWSNRHRTRKNRVAATHVWAATAGLPCGSTPAD